MTLDYKHRGEPKEPKKQPVPAWVWLVVGLSIGLFAAFLGFLVAQKPADAPQTTATPATTSAPTVTQPVTPPPQTVATPAPTQTPAPSAAASAPAEQQPAAPKFSFYTALPDLEVEIPEEELQRLTGDKKPLPQTPTSTQDSIDTPQEQANTTMPAPTATEKAPTKDSVSLNQPPKSTVPQSQPTTPDNTAPPATKAGNKYVLQVGSYASQSEAERVKAKLAFAGISANVQAVSSGSTEKRYRVRVGPYATLEQADAVKQQLRQQNMQAIMLKIAK